jgi:hypothetical protein
MSRDDMKPIQPPVKWVPEVLSSKLKWLEFEGDHSTVTSIKIKNVRYYVSLHPYMSWWHGAWLSTGDKFHSEIILVFLNRNLLFSSYSPSFVHSNYFHWYSSNACIWLVHGLILNQDTSYPDRNSVILSALYADTKAVVWNISWPNFYILTIHEDLSIYFYNIEGKVTGCGGP